MLSRNSLWQLDFRKNTAVSQSSQENISSRSIRFYLNRASFCVNQVKMPENTQQMQEERREPFWTSRQTFYISVLCIAFAVLVAASNCVLFFADKPDSRSS